MQLALVSSDCFPDSTTTFFFVFLIFLSYPFYPTWASITSASLLFYFLATFSAIICSGPFWSCWYILHRVFTSEIISSVYYFSEFQSANHKYILHPWDTALSIGKKATCIDSNSTQGRNAHSFMPDPTWLYFLSHLNVVGESYLKGSVICLQKISILAAATF